jgi:dienelactone hydrolase
LKLYFDDVAFDGQLQRSVGKSDSGMANVGECLAIAGQITPGDRDSWYQAWSGFAAHLVSQADEAAEELYASVAPAVERGYAFAALDGPGQGAMLYDRRVPMRPDWENVVPGMFDAITANPEVDPTRVTLVGRSFGGLIAPRGAGGEHRLAAMIVDPGQYDLGAAATARLGLLANQIHDPAADPQFASLLDIPAVKAFLAPRMATHGVTSVRAYLADILRYTNADTATQVSCPTFVTDNETDEVSPGQGKVLFDHLTCPKEFRLFTKAEGAEGHCEGMAPIVFWDAAFNWLDSQLTS